MNAYLALKCIAYRALLHQQHELATAAAAGGRAGHPAAATTTNNSGGGSKNRFLVMLSGLDIESGGGRAPWLLPASPWPIKTGTPRQAVCRKAAGFLGSALFFFALFLLSCALPNSWEAWTSGGVAGFQAKLVSSPCGATPGGMCPEYDNATLKTVQWIWATETTTDATTAKTKTAPSLVLKIFPDLYIFYGFLLLLLAAGFVVQEWDLAYYALHRPRRWLRGATLAQWGTGAMFLGAVALWMAYWLVAHNFHEDWPKKGDKTPLEKWARSLGQLGNLLLGLLLFPVSRSSCWTSLCGIAWDRALKVHIVLGYAFLASVAAHMFCWWAIYNENKFFPHDVLAVPMYYPANTDNVTAALEKGPSADNFTVPLVSLLVWPMFLLMGVLSCECVRRKRFEVFYYAHHFFMVVVGMALWHAASAWYFLAPGVLTWVLDRLLRFASGTDPVHVVAVRSATADGSVTCLEIQKPVAAASRCPLAFLFRRGQPQQGQKQQLLGGREEHLMASPCADSALGASGRSAGSGGGGGGGGYSGDGGRNGAISSSKASSKKGQEEAGEVSTTMMGPLAHAPGQFAFVQIPSISSLEWHPFSIASSPLDRTSTFFIKNTAPGSGEFTDQLSRIARGLGNGNYNYNNNNNNNNNAKGGTAISRAGSGGGALQVNIDGPYGQSIFAAAASERYESVVLVAGGIGITPLHSTFRHLYGLAQQAAAEMDEEAGAAVAARRRVHLVWVSRSVELFYLFEDTFHAVANDPIDGRFGFSFFATRAGGSGGAAAGGAAAAIAQHPPWLREHCAPGRPDLGTTLSELVDTCGGASKALIWACGPNAMVDESSRIASGLGAHFLSESFEL